MNILVVSQYFWPENFKINDLVKELIDKGNSVTVLTGIPNYPEGKFYKGYSIFKPYKEKKFGAKIIRVPLWPRKNGNGFNLALNYISFMITASFYSFLFKKKKFDKILVFEISPITVGIPAIVAKFKIKAPIYFWVLDLWPESVFSASNLKSNFIRKLLNTLVKYIYKRCDKILISSKSFLKSIKEKGVDGNKIHYFPNWAEDIFMTNPNKYEIELPKGFIFLYAGNIGKAQDFNSIIKGIELTKDYNEIKWVIVGSGREENNVKKLIINKKLQEKVILLGRYPVETMPYLFSKADVLFFALKDEPIFSLTVPAKLQTYLAAKKPILGMISGEGNRIIKDAQCGFVVPASNHIEFSKKAIEFYTLSKNQHKAMALNGYRYYKNNFDKNILINQLILLLNTK